MNTHTHAPAHQRYHEAKKATLYGALKNILLGFFKVILGVTGHSHALVADGVHSFSDLLTDILVLFASQWGSLEADTNHPYGHQRIETAASVFLAFILMIAGLTISYDAAMHLIFTQSHERPHFYVLLVALASVLFNESLFRYTLYTAKKIKSDLLLANAWHHRSDAASSLVVLIGVIGAVLGFYWFDSVAACIVGVMIIKMGGEVAWTSICELVDTGVKPEALDEIAKTISKTPGVRAIHQLRTRSMGGAIFVDVHILVNHRLSVSEGHHIAEQVHKSLSDEIENVKDVTVHVDPEDDTIVSRSLDLPSRMELFEILKKYNDFEWERYYSQIVLHYWHGKISVDVYVEEHEYSQISALVPNLLANIPILKEITVYYKEKKK